MFKPYFEYDDIWMIPRPCMVFSRVECTIAKKLGPLMFKTPVVPANMKTVVDHNTCKYLAEKGMFYIYHRFDMKLAEFVNFCDENGIYKSISVGVNGDSYDELKTIKGKRIEYITIDIAHADAPKTKMMIKFIKDNFHDSYLIVGNVGSVEGIWNLKEFGADAVKCGIGPGSACLSKVKTGFCVQSASLLKEIKESGVKFDIDIIADGGIRHPGDIAKAIALGADFVMAGQLFAGYDQSAGDLINIDGKLCKEYFGSASEHNKGEKKHVEGTRTLIPYKGNMDELIQDLTESLKSAVSYAGGTKLEDLRKVDFYIKG